MLTRCSPPPHLGAAAENVVPGKVSIVVLNWNAMPFLDRCLGSIVRHTRADYELVIVDNGSTDGSKDLIRSFIGAHRALAVEFLDHSENLYFSKGFNSGFRATSRNAEYVMMVCNDVEVKEDAWLADLVTAMSNPRVIAAGHAQPESRLSPEQREIFRRNDPLYGNADLARRMRRLVNDPSFTYTHIYGYCFLLRRRHLERTGLYLEDGDFKQYNSDWEWYVRFKALGFEIASVLPKVHHWHSISELVAFHPHLYRDLLRRIADPAVNARYLLGGRPLYEEESGYREIHRPKEQEHES